VPADPDIREFEELTEVADLRRQLGDAQVRLRRAKAKTADLVEAVRQGAKDAAVLLGNPPAVAPPKADRRTRGMEVALLHLSDWQVGKVTESFNQQVAGRRVDALTAKVVRLTEIERADHPVKEVHVLWGGDMVEGLSIFPGQAFEVDAGLFGQMFAAVGAGERLLRGLLANFDRVVCWQEYGNHGRLGRKGDVPKVDNADLLVYELIREKLPDDRIVWNPPQSWYSIVEIGSYHALLVHGDEIKSLGAQTPAFGITKKVNAWATGVVPPFTDCYMGHWHQPLVLPVAHGKGRTFVNPSLESDNVYAQEFVGANGAPGQRLNFIDPGAGRVTTERVIWLAHVA